MEIEKLQLTWGQSEKWGHEAYLSDDGSDWIEVYIADSSITCYLCEHVFYGDWVWQTDDVGDPREVCLKHVELVVP